MDIYKQLREQFLAFGISRLKRLSQEGSWILAGQIISVLGSLMLVRVLTEYLNPAEYGKLALGLTVAGLVNQVVMGGLISGIGRFYSIAIEKSDLYGYLQASRRLMVYGSLSVGMIALVLTLVLIGVNQTQWLTLVAVVLVFSVLSGFNASLSGVQTAARQRANVVFHNGANAWLKIGLAVAVIIWLGASSTAVVIGYSLSALLVTVSQWYFLRRFLRRQILSSKGRVIENWVLQMWTFSWPFSIWGVFTWLQQSSDRWALETFASTQDVGQYAVMFQLGYVPIGIVTNLAVSLLAPILYQRAGAANDPIRNQSVHRVVWQIAKVSLAVTGFAFLVTLFWHDHFFQMLVAAQFQSSSYFLPWMVLAGGLFAAGQMLALKLMSEMKVRDMLGAKVGTALLGLLCNLLGAWLFGLGGVVVGLLIFSIIYFGWMSWLAQNLPSFDNVNGN